MCHVSITVKDSIERTFVEQCVCVHLNIIRMSANMRESTYGTMKRKLRRLRRISIDNMSRHAITSVLAESIFSLNNPVLASAGSSSSLNEQVIPEAPEIDTDLDSTEKSDLLDDEMVEDNWIVELLDSLRKNGETSKPRSRNSFRILSNKSKDKRVQVKAHLSIEDLEKKKCDLERTIQFHKDAVHKNIPEFLSDSATILLENIISLASDLTEILTASRSPAEVKNLSKNLHKSVAELMWWSNQFHLHGQQFKSNYTLDQITDDLKSSIATLVDFTINKENQKISNTSTRSGETPQNSRLILNGTRNNSHHGSLPEIPTLTLNDTSSEDAFNQSQQLSPNSKLMHSLSSDSILDYKEGSHAAPNNVYASNNSLADSVPPIPPKKLRHKACGYESPLSPLRQSSPIPMNDVCLRHSTGSCTPCSMSHSFDHVSPATSHHSMNHSLEERRSCHSLDSTEQSQYSDSHLLPHSPHSPADSRVFTYGDVSPANNYDVAMSQYRDHSIYTNKCSSPSYTSSSSKLTQMFESSHQNKILSQTKTSHECSTQVTSQTLNKQVVYHHTSRLSKCSSSTSSSRSSDIETEGNRITMAVPPELPRKLRHKHGNMSPDRVTSQYENVSCSSLAEGVDCVDGKLGSCADVICKKYPAGGLFTSSRSSSSTCSESGLGSSVATLESCNAALGIPADALHPMSSLENTVVHRRFHESFMADSLHVNGHDAKPPLPLKKRHILEYLEIVKDYQRLPEKDQRRSQQTFIGYQGNSLLDTDLFISSRLSLPPALPPKLKLKNRELDLSNHNQIIDEPMSQLAHTEATVCPCMLQEKDKQPDTELGKIPTDELVVIPSPTAPKVNEFTTVPEPAQAQTKEKEADVDHGVLDLFDVSEYLVMNNKNGVPYVAAGHPEALLVYATYSTIGDAFMNAFLTTYRTFMTPEALLDKLSYRYKKHRNLPNDPDSVKASETSFALFVKAVNELIEVDLKDPLLEKLSTFEYDLLADGELEFALLFRNELAAKLNLKRTTKVPIDLVYPTPGQHNVHHTLLDFTSIHIAEQITLLESESFNRVGIPEALHWSRDQNEEQCPNLRAFTMHFNAISFWVKTMLLKCHPHERERYFRKFVKIIKHLRRFNNFNSCLAILSAIESSAIERLGLHHNVQEELKDYHILFDHFSFKVYRKELASADVPVIPYLGIILKDLTLAHYGNSDYVGRHINYEKRWIQYKILNDIKKFTPTLYKYKKNEAILKFFDGFKNSLSEDEVWAHSYKIKPKNNE